MKYTFKNNFQKIEYNPNFAPKRGDYPREFVKEEPLVSVVVRTHKRKEVLRRTLKSLENQLYKNFEVVIVGGRRKHRRKYGEIGLSEP